MKYHKINGMEQEVSEVCLGTMTFGEQNNQSESFEIMDTAFERGVNFFDTAEMYPIPPNKSTVHRTEEIIGNWKGFHQNRDKIIMATKVIGPTDFMTWIRNGSPRLDKKNITLALEESLKRLKTDYIDLYQIHWPSRVTNYFGQLGFKEPKTEQPTPILETLEILDQFVSSGKIKAIGLSNETPWGIMQFLKEAKNNNLPVVSTVQNPYSLLNRTYEVGCSEISYREGVKLLSYSPLGFGVLTGKYLEGKDEPTSRLNLFSQYSRYSNKNAVAATKRYLDLAKSFNLTLTQLALAFCYSRSFMGSTIIGATNTAQLIENIDATEVVFTKELENKISQIHEDLPNPSP